MVNKNEEPNLPAKDIPILFKIGEHFIPQQQIRSVVRFGKGCKIILANGAEILVKINFDKVSDLVQK